MIESIIYLDRTKNHQSVIIRVSITVKLNQNRNTEEGTIFSYFHFPIHAAPNIPTFIYLTL